MSRLAGYSHPKSSSSSELYVLPSFLAQNYKKALKMKCYLCKYLYLLTCQQHFLFYLCIEKRVE